jgi:hypothetical protein
MNSEQAVWLFLTGLLSTVISGCWNHLSKRTLQRDDAETKEKLTKLQNQFDQAEQRAQAENERSLIVTRAHFETEFETMKQVFECLSRLGFCVAAMRPVDEPCPTQHEADNRLFELRNEYNLLRKLLEAKLPFYTEELYEPVKACLSAAWHETDDLDRMKDPYDVVGYKRAESNQAIFQENYKKAADIIRKRFNRLVVLPK